MKIKYKLSDYIKDNKYPRTSKNYSKCHSTANTYEKLKFGNKRFKELNKIINSDIPKGSLAGSHNKHGTIIISTSIPKKFRDQIAYHEYIEHKCME